MKVKDLVGYYEGSFGVVQGVNGVSIDVNKGDRIAIAGESGCGKTTFAELLTGTPEPLLHYKSGLVEVGDYDVWHISDDVLREEVKHKRLSYVPQASLNALNPIWRIKKFVSVMLEERRNENISPDKAKDEIAGHFENLGLDRDVLDLYTHELSGGMAQRAVIAISTFAQPDVLIVDEPTSALDVSSQRKMVELLLYAQKEGIIESIVAISHDLPTLRQLCDRLAVMYGGKFVEVGSIIDIIEEPLHPYTKALLDSCVPMEEDVKEKPLQSIEGLPPDLRDLPSGCYFHPRCSKCMKICKKEHPSPVEVNGRKVSCWLYGDKNE